ncbi:MAG: hypothetical protein JWQ62_2599 [Lacunisphaera sp.]|nr:hypothetical protein [Lacunisphaera sp.]
MPTIEQIENDIRALPAEERARLMNDLPKLFPELDGDAAWDRIIHDDRPRPALSRLLDEVDAALAEDPAKYPDACPS